MAYENGQAKVHAGSGVPSTVKCDKMQSVAQVCPRCESRYHDEAIFCQVDGVRLVAEEEGADPYLGTELLGQFRIEEILGEVLGGFGLPWEDLVGFGMIWGWGFDRIVEDLG